MRAKIVLVHHSVVGAAPQVGAVLAAQVGISAAGGSIGAAWDILLNKQLALVVCMTILMSYKLLFPKLKSVKFEGLDFGSTKNLKLCRIINL